ncbi:glutathione S-transferase 1-like [Vanessa cardui]|uniref:glutathione S-transferase 1-like n=1 Tax=Vanessa cardui TaxID=171605 RepID=UPI001F131AAD|nr:glutathione S-transferase 1-like [Vanessa cardui]
MPLKIHKMDFSPPVGAALMVCDVHNVPIETIDINLFAREHLKPEYVKKNPMHTIPLLEDDDFIIHDSHAIMMYISDKYGKDDSLYPKDLQKRALVNQQLFFDTLLFYRTRSITFAALIEGVRKPTEKQLNDLHEGYSFLEGFLSKTKFVAGDNMTIADISILSSVSAMRHIIPIDDTKYPKTAAWFKFMTSQSFFKKCAEKGSLIFGEMLKKAMDL